MPAPRESRGATRDARRSLVVALVAVLVVAPVAAAGSLPGPPVDRAEQPSITPKSDDAGAALPLAGVGEGSPPPATGADDAWRRQFAAGAAGPPAAVAPAAVGGAPAAPEEVTIGFEEIPGTGPTTAGMELHRQYVDAYGVEFVPPDGEAHGAEVVECGAFNSPCPAAHGGDMAGVPVFPGGGDVGDYESLTVRFDDPQKVVSVFVRHRETDEDFTAVATMTAKDDGGNQLDVERVTFPSDGGWQELSVGNPYGSANIVEVVVAGGTDGEFPYDNEIVVDDLTFVTEPGDTSPDETAPLLEMYQPLDGVTVDYETARSGLELQVAARDARQLSTVAYRIDDGPEHLLCGSRDGVSVGACPGDDVPFEAAVPLTLPGSDGTYTITIEACDLAGNCASEDADVTVSLPPPAAITSADPLVVYEDVVLRENPRWVVNGTRTVNLTGSFHDRTAVWLFAGCTVGEFPDHCEYRTEIDDANVSIAPNGSRMTVVVPRDVPGRIRLNRRFFWGVYDEIYGHPGDDSWSAENWAKSEEFTFRPDASYVESDSFRFDNDPGAAGRQVFQGTYGKVAFGCFPGTRGCIPRPMYFTIWLPVYRGWLESSGGSCVGMAATSQLLARSDDRFQMLGQPADLTASSFDADANHAAGLLGDGPFMREPPKPARYGNYPKRPRNLWGVIRSNHGVQTSIEYITEFVTRGGGARASDPSAVVERVRTDPTDYVLCMKDGTSGHCVSPYDVVDVDGRTSRIYVYDNNFPQDLLPYNNTGDEAIDGYSDYGPRYVEVDTVDEHWYFPTSFTKNTSHDKYEQWQGGDGGLYAVPLSIWEEKRHAPVDFISAGGDVRAIRHSFNLVFGGADAMYETADGRWGWERDGTFVDDMPSATAMVPSGQPDPDNRFVPLLVPPGAGPLSVRITTRGERYGYHTSQPGRSFQLDVSGTAPGQTDRVALGTDGDRITELRYTPERDRSGLLARVGEAYGEGEEAVFVLSGLSVRSKRSVAVGTVDGERGVRYTNDGGAATGHHLVVRSFDVTGEEPVNGTYVFGPFDVPDGATQTVTVADWPDASRVRVELDRDGDGTVDESRLVDGQRCHAPLGAPDADGDGIPDGCALPGDHGPLDDLVDVPLPAFLGDLPARGLGLVLAGIALGLLVLVVRWRR